MKKLMTALGLAAFLAAPAFAADPVVGKWRTIADDNGNSGIIDVVECGAKICGTLITSFDSAGKEFKSENEGKQIIWDMVPEGNGAYGNGKIWSPDQDKVYLSKMQMSGNKLTVKGCVLGGLVCRDGGTWTRVQ